MSTQINLDDELSSESDRLPHPMRIALWLKKYEHLTMFNLKAIMQRNFDPVDIEIALDHYMNNRV